MKKIFALIIVAVIALFSFAGCGNVGDAAKEAGELVTEAVDTVAGEASEMMDNTYGDINDTNDNGNISQN